MEPIDTDLDCDELPQEAGDYELEECIEEDGYFSYVNPHADSDMLVYIQGHNQRSQFAGDDVPDSWIVDGVAIEHTDNGERGVREFRVNQGSSSEEVERGIGATLQGNSDPILYDELKEHIDEDLGRTHWGRK